MKKLFLSIFLVGLFFSFENTALAIGANASGNRIPVVDCSRFQNSQCKPSGASFTSDACDNGNDSNEGGTEDYLGYCTTGEGGIMTARQDCCVPDNSVTQAQIDAATRREWIRESVCEAPIAQGGLEGNCRYTSILGNLNPINWFTGTGVCDGEYPAYAGYCGGAGGNAVCCISQRTANDIGVGQLTDTRYGDYQLLEQIPGSSNTSGELQPYLESIYKVGLVLIVLGAVFMIGVGGFIYMGSAGNTSAIKKGKGLITDAIIGLVVALCIWLILNIINPDLVNLQINPLRGISFDPNSSGAIAAIDGAQTPDGEGTAGSTNNCNAVPESELETFAAAVTNGEPEKARRQTVERFMQMREAAARENIRLQVTDGYRSPDEQVSIWNSNGCRIESGRTVCNGGRLVARPCSMGGGGSNHASGNAIDISVGCSNGQSNCNTSIYRWLQANGGRFGFYNRIPTDPVHWSSSGR